MGPQNTAPGVAILAATYLNTSRTIATSTPVTLIKITQ